MNEQTFSLDEDQIQAYLTPTDHAFFKLSLLYNTYTHNEDLSLLQKLSNHPMSKEDAFEAPALLISLLEQVQGNRLIQEQASPDAVADGIIIMFDIIQNNQALTAAPENEIERAAFYFKIAKGFRLIADGIQHRLENASLSKEEAFACIETIGLGGRFCASRWRLVLEELLPGLSMQLPKLELSNAVIDPLKNTLQDILNHSLLVESKKLAEEFVSTYYSRVNRSAKLHVINAFLRHLNEKNSLNLPITLDKDTYLGHQESALRSKADFFIDRSDFSDRIINRALELLKDKVMEAGETFDHITNWALQFYRHHQLENFIPDRVTFLSDHVFHGFTKEIQEKSLMLPFWSKGFFRMDLEPFNPLTLSRYIHHKQWTKLSWAIRNSNIQSLPPISTESGYTSLLTYCIGIGQRQLAKQIILRGIDIHTADIAKEAYWDEVPTDATKGKTPLHMAILRKDSELLRLLLDKGANPHEAKMLFQNKKSYTPYALAIAQNTPLMLAEILKKEIDAGENPLLPVGKGLTPLLTYFIAHGVDAIAKKMIHNGANIACKDKGGSPFGQTQAVYLPLHHRTALHTAVKTGNLEMVSLLTAKGADPLADTIKADEPVVGNNLNALELALHCKQTDIFRFLAQMIIAQRNNPLLQTGTGKTSLLSALILLGEKDLAKELVLQGADIHQADVTKSIVKNTLRINAISGRSPLHAAIQKGDLEIVTFLLSQGADPAKKSICFGNKEKMNALELAATMGHLPILLKLAEKYILSGENLSLRWKQENHSLLGILTLAGENTSAIKLLHHMQRFASSPEANHRTPASFAKENEKKVQALHLAIQKDNREMVQLLLADGVCPLTPLTSKETKHGLTALDIALREKKHSILEDLAAVVIGQGLNPYLHLPGGKATLLSTLTLLHKNDLAKLLLEKGADIHQPDLTCNHPQRKDFFDGFKTRLPLHAAIYSGNLEMTRLFLERGADPMAPLQMQDGTYNGLELAFAKNEPAIFIELANVLAHQGKNPMLSLQHGKIPLINLLLLINENEIAKKLLHSQINIHHKEVPSAAKLTPSPWYLMKGRLPIHIAVMKQDSEMTKALLDSGANPFHETLRLPDGRDYNAFELALQDNNQSLLQTIVGHYAQKGLNPMIQTRTGKTPLLTYLITREQPLLAQQLLASGADVNAKDESLHMGWGNALADAVKSRRAIHMAVKTGNFQLVQSLLTHQADPSKRIRLGLTKKVDAARLAENENHKDIAALIRNF